MRVIGSVLYWVSVVILSLVMFCIAVAIWLVTLPFDPKKKVLQQFTCFWGSLGTLINPAWRIKFHGREHIESGKAYVITPNHLSLLDILVLLRLFKHFKFIAKIEVLKIPIVGWNMRLNNYIALKRGDRESIAEMLDDAERTLRSGSSIMIFPEGTRSVEGTLKPFKWGAFELAKLTGCEIVPIAIRGTGSALPAHGLILEGRHNIDVQVLPPVPLDVIESMETQELAEYVRGLISTAIAEADA